MRYHEIVSEGRTIEIDGKSPYEKESKMMRFFENPSLSQIISLAARFDLRGSADGESVFVWDARQIIHHNARYHLRHESQFGEDNVPYAFNFYVINKNTKSDRQTREEWASSKRCDFYLVNPLTVISVMKNWGPKLELIPSFSRLVQGASMIPTIRSKPSAPDQSSSSSSPVPGSITA
jgi:hypothetical protein